MTLANMIEHQERSNARGGSDSVQIRSGVLGVRNDYFVSGQFVESGTIESIALASTYDKAVLGASRAVDRTDPRARKHRSISILIAVTAAAAAFSGVFVIISAVAVQNLTGLVTGITLSFVAGVVALIAWGLFRSISN